MVNLVTCLISISSHTNRKTRSANSTVEMDILSILQTHFLSLILGVVVLLLFWKSRGKHSSFEKLPPGPAPLPIVGNLFQVDLKEPYKYYQEVSRLLIAYFFLGFSFYLQAKYGAQQSRTFMLQPQITCSYNPKETFYSNRKP